MSFLICTKMSTRSCLKRPLMLVESQSFLAMAFYIFFFFILALFCFGSNRKCLSASSSSFILALFCFESNRKCFSVSSSSFVLALFCFGSNGKCLSVSSSFLFWLCFVSEVTEIVFLSFLLFNFGFVLFRK